MPSVAAGTLLAALSLGLACATIAPRTDPLERTLARAGANRPELERVIAHYVQEGDAQKLDAARFLIANMEAHGYVEFGRFDAAGAEVPFDALAYPSFDAALSAVEALEATRGPLSEAPRRIVRDLETVRADLLIENIDLAFAAWRESPWSSAVSSETFREYVLPYRGSNEPLGRWRPALRGRLDGTLVDLVGETDPVRAGERIWEQTRSWVAFSERYYLHPTDQGYDEMLAAGEGRCEDMANLATFAARAAGVPAAQDYTPFWADRDNNHAWEVLLGPDGRGHAPLAHRAAKVYRRAFSSTSDGPLAHVGDPSDLPPGLPHALVRDVTDQYGPTSDLRVHLDRVPATDAPLAYLAVFNAGEWRAVHWGVVDRGEVVFTRMGRGIVYLPMLFEDGALVPASAPLILDEQGVARRLAGDAAGAERMALVPPASPVPPDATVRLPVAARLDHELFVWEDGWRSLARHDAGQGARVTEAPAGRLYWLVADGSRRLERVFTVEAGQQVYW